MQEIVNLILVDGHGEELNSSHRRQIFESADVTLQTKEEIHAAGPILRQMTKDPSPRVITTHVPYSLLPKQYNEKPCKVKWKPNSLHTDSFAELNRNFHLSG